MAIVKNLLASFLIAAFTSFGAGLAGFLISSTIFNTAGSFQISITLFTVCFAISYAVLALRTTLRCAFERSAVSKALRVRNEKGYCDEYYRLLDLNRRRGGVKKRFMNSISYAGELADGDRYDEAEKVLSELSDTAAAMNEKLRADYINACAYIFLMDGKTELAEIALDADSGLIMKQAQTRRDGGSIYHTLGVLEYAKGNLSRAENLFIRAKRLAGLVYSKNACDLYLGLVYLKTGRREYAKAAVSSLIKNVENPRQALDTKKLMKLVEEEYGI